MVRDVSFFFLHEIGVGIGPLKGVRGIPREKGEYRWVLANDVS